MPFSDPLADGPVIHAAGTRALAAGATLDRVLEVAASLSSGGPIVLMCYSNLILARGPERFAAALSEAGASGLIVPDLPPRGGPTVLEALGRRGRGARAARRADDHRREDGGHRRARPGLSYTVSLTGTTGERAALADRFEEVVSRARAHTQVPVALGFGIGTPEQALEAARPERRRDRRQPPRPCRR